MSTTNPNVTNAYNVHLEFKADESATAEKEIRGGRNNALWLKYNDLSLQNEKETISKESEYRRFLLSTCDLYIFDSQDNLVFRNRELHDFKIDYDPFGVSGSRKGKITANAVSFPVGFYNLFSNSENQKKTDYEICLKTGFTQNKILFNARNNSYNCKIVARGILVDTVNCSHEVIFNFPKAKIFLTFQPEMVADGSTVSTLHAEFYPYNSEDDMFEMNFVDLK